MAARKPSAFLIVLVFAAFVSIGLPDAIFGAAWPSIRSQFGMGNAAVGFLNIPGSLAYIASSALLGTVMRRLGVATLLSGSTALVGIGLTIYATAPTFWMIIPAVMLISVGSGAIDAALNLFAANRLPTKYMSWLHAFYGVGALVGPFIMAFVYTLGHSWRWGYATIAAIIWVMTMVFILTRSHWHADSAQQLEDESEAPSPISGREVLGMPRVRLSMLQIAMSAIGECLAALWIASILLQRFDVENDVASLGAAIFWIGLTGGRMLIPVFWPEADPLRILNLSTLLLIVACAMMIPAWLPIVAVGVLLVGVANAALFPAQISIVNARFGAAIGQHATGYLISASTAMFAVMPLISGWLADETSMVVIPVIMLAAAIGLLIVQTILARGDEQPGSA